MPLFWWYAVLAHSFCKLCRLKIGLQFSILLWKYFHIFFHEKRSAVILQNHADCTWNPPNLLFNQYWGFFLRGGGVKNGWRVIMTTHFHLLPMLKMSGAIPLLPLYAFMLYVLNDYALTWRIFIFYMVGRERGGLYWNLSRKFKFG